MPSDVELTLEIVRSRQAVNIYEIMRLASLHCVCCVQNDGALQPIATLPVLS